MATITNIKPMKSGIPSRTACGTPKPQPLHLPDRLRGRSWSELPSPPLGGSSLHASTLRVLCAVQRGGAAPGITSFNPCNKPAFPSVIASLAPPCLDPRCHATLPSNSRSTRVRPDILLTTLDFHRSGILERSMRLFLTPAFSYPKVIHTEDR